MMIADTWCIIDQQSVWSSREQGCKVSSFSWCQMAPAWFMWPLVQGHLNSRLGIPWNF